MRDKGIIKDGLASGEGDKRRRQGHKAGIHSSPGGHIRPSVQRLIPDGNLKRANGRRCLASGAPPARPAIGVPGRRPTQRRRGDSLDVQHQRRTSLVRGVAALRGVLACQLSLTASRRWTPAAKMQFPTPRPAQAPRGGYARFGRGETLTGAHAWPLWPSAQQVLASTTTLSKSSLSFVRMRRIPCSTVLCPSQLACYVCRYACKEEASLSACFAHSPTRTLTGFPLCYDIDARGTPITRHMCTWQINVRIPRAYGGEYHYVVLLIAHTYVTHTTLTVRQHDRRHTSHVWPKDRKANHTKQ